MGFKQPKNPITLIGLVLPWLAFEPIAVTYRVGQYFGSTFSNISRFFRHEDVSS
jgi:hypothetical protein